MLATVMLILILNATFFYSDNDNLTQFMFKKKYHNHNYRCQKWQISLHIPLLMQFCVEIFEFKTKYCDQFTDLIT